MTAVIVWSAVSAILGFGLGAATAWLKNDIRLGRAYEAGALAERARAALATPGTADDLAVGAERKALDDRLAMEQLALDAANAGSVAKVIELLKPKR